MTRRTLRLTSVATGLLLAASVAVAQPARKEEPLKPPVPPSTGTNWSPLMSMFVGVLMSGLVLGVAFIPSKRGHQD